MLLEMDNNKLLALLSEQNALMNKINEAMAVLKNHHQKKYQQSIQGQSSQNMTHTATPNGCLPQKSFNQRVPNNIISNTN